jgi:hypothetical protein
VTIGTQGVLKALAELRVNRPRHAADQHIRHLLRTYGNGASSISELDPAYYESVWRAAGGVLSAAEMYGTITDIPARPIQPPSAPPARTRILSPLVADLERKLAERAGKPRSRPNYVVNVGNPAQFGDEAPPPQYPNDGWRVS